VTSTYLLDTATLIWAATQPEKLSAEARKICASDGAHLMVSVVSLMELIVKVQKGKLSLAPDPLRWWNHNVSELGLSVLPLRQEHIEQLWTLPWVHRDPADRLLIAQAIAEGVPLVSPDEAIGQYPVEVFW